MPKDIGRRGLLKRAGVAFLGAQGLTGQKSAPKPATVSTAKPDDCHCAVAADGTLLDTGTSEIRPLIDRYLVELRDYERIYPLPGSSARQTAMEAFYKAQLRLLDEARFDQLSQAGKVDYLLMRSRLIGEQKDVMTEAQREAEIAPLIPFQQTIVGFEESRRRMETIDGQKSAITLDHMLKDIAAAKDSMSGKKPNSAALSRAARRLEDLRVTLRGWYDFYALYDPKFVWWTETPFKKADEAVEAHAQYLHTTSGVGGTLEPATGGGRGGGGRGGATGGGGRGGGGRASRPAAGPMGSDAELSGVGPAGREALLDALRTAMIAYTPEQLIEVANREFAWCDKEMLRASKEMGFADDWKKALEAVKNKYVEPGQMIYLVRDLSREAVDYLEKNQLVTVPELVKQDYWEEAMTPQMQLVNPFFTGGATIQVSSPASSQTVEERLEALRGNNIYFARATVFHELIPGHHMQQYMTQRYRAYRSIFSTPFWTEGMAFYWEMLLWDLGFTHTPEQRVGALFWRMHRCARIIFSLSFHLGKMKAVECVQFLVDRVGHEKANAEGEVRRSFNGSYQPIYQCAYMLGALQFYALHKEFVGSGKMTNRAFHDALYQQGNMPVEMVRLAISGQKVDRNYQASWKFYGDIA
jgi:uncharacterized protein (DUF885 family)